MNISKVLSSKYLLNTAKSAAKSASGFSYPITARLNGENIIPDKFIKSANAMFNSAPEAVPKVVDDKYLQQLSEKMYRNAKQDFTEYMAMFKKAFGDTGIPLTGRVKEPSSTFSKLSKRAHYIKEGYNPMSLVPDVYGYKLITDGSPEQIESVVKNIEKLLDDGTLEPSHILNHGAIPYFNDEQISRLNKRGFLISDNGKKSGFSGVNMYFEDISTGKRLELQIKGRKVNKISEQEHLWYNFKTKGSATKRGKIAEKFQKAFLGLTETQTKLYEQYVDECYRYSRNLEIGNCTPKPVLPEGFNSILKLV